MNLKKVILSIMTALTLSLSDASYANEERLADLDNLSSHLKALTSTPSYRNYKNLDSLTMAAQYIYDQFKKIGLETSEQRFFAQSSEYKNIIGRLNIPGRDKKIVIGAHYDVYGEQDGADDNGSGVAGLIELARILKAGGERLNYNIEFVGYTLEEPPFFGSDLMGSYIHAKSLHDKGERIEGMISLEMIGYFREEEGSQEYPSVLLKPFFPSKGNFISAVSNLKSRNFLKRFKKGFESNSRLPVETMSAPAFITGIDFSDHKNYWEFGYDAVMVTDTAFFRNKHYHRDDTIDTIDISKIGEVIDGIARLILNNML